jgi:hypothetical protein
METMAAKTCSQPPEPEPVLFKEIADFLATQNNDRKFEEHFEINCPLCIGEDGFETCQGHLYSDETGYIS